MGKEWYWGSGSNKSSNSKREAAKDCTTTGGCMSAVFQFFDFHHFQFPLNHHHHAATAVASFKPNNSSLAEDHPHHTILKVHSSGVDAPRNSLELAEPPLSSSYSTILKEDENLNISMGIQIKTRSSSSSSEVSSSPGAKTPNLVARLMGLDILPNEPQSPSFSSSSCHETPNNLSATKSNLHYHFRNRQQQYGKLISHRHSVDVGTRSLPETPRISLARRSVDVDHHHHRLSLQINKENINVGEELEFSYLRRKEINQDDEYRSPSHYARKIAKQVKESVSRKVGLDITNTLRNRGSEQAITERDHEQKAKKNCWVLNKVVDQSSPGKHSSSTPSCSPRLSRFLEPKQKITTSSNTHSQAEQANNNVIQPRPMEVLSSKSKLLLVQEQETTNQYMINEQRPAKKSKKSAGEKFNSRLKKPPQTTDIIRNKQEEPFVRPSAASRANFPDKKCKQTPLSNDLLNITVPTLLPVRKDTSPPATKLPPKQVLSAQSSKRDSQLSSNTSQTYKHEATRMLVAQDNINGRPNFATTAEYEYLTRILKCTGINKDTQVSFTNWFSPSHPLDPCIFHQLENTNRLTGQLTHYCNRKLMFELVDEILVDILKPYIKMKPWVKVRGSSEINIGRDYIGHMKGSALIDMLCKQIRSYPCADCRVLEDIDGLIDRDLPQMKMQKRTAFEEEGEGVVMEIEKDILDTLIHETAVELKRWRIVERRVRDRRRVERQEAEGSHGCFT